MIGKIAVSAAVFTIDKPYSYRIPEGMTVLPGHRVQLPFGRANKTAEGIVLSVEPGQEEGLKSIQCVLDEEKRKELFQELDIMQSEQRGSLLTLTVRGTREEVLRKVEEKEPIFYEILPLTLEEIFISETEVAGYDIKSLLV